MSNKKMISIVFLSVALACFVCCVWVGGFCITEFNALKNAPGTSGADYLSIFMVGGITLLGTSLTGCFVSLISLCQKASKTLQVLSTMSSILFALMFLAFFFLLC